MSINDDFADSEYGDDLIDQESFSDTTSDKFDAKAGTLSFDFFFFFDL